jgi:hypothetical protein
MEVFGGFMMLVSIVGFFLTVIWFLVPFVIFNIKGRVDRTLELVESLDRRLALLEVSLKAQAVPAAAAPAAAAPASVPAHEPAAEETTEH